jgi:hypothetical protein
VTWIIRARRAIAGTGRMNAGYRLKKYFVENLQGALAECNRTVWPLPDAFTPAGAVIPEGLRIRTEATWEHFLQGTYGLCVANAVSERAIARQQVLEEKLLALTEDGMREHYTATQAHDVLIVLEQYTEASMPFSPIDEGETSRKRLVAALRLRITQGSGSGTRSPTPGHRPCVFESSQSHTQ